MNEKELLLLPVTEIFSNDELIQFIKWNGRKESTLEYVKPFTSCPTMG